MIDELKKLFESYREDMLKDLGTLVAINSERGETTEEFPFGEGPAKALHTFLKMAEDMGFKTDNVDNYAGVVEYGEAEESVGVLAHLDVVPAGKGWDSDPFTLVIRDGQMYGRGTCDDKGPAVAALYTLKAIRELGIPLKRGIKLVVGTNEEQGSACIEYYKAHRPLPTLGFTPDGSYPVTYAEKGCVWQYLNFPHEETPIISFKSGNAINAVPCEALVIVDGKATSEEALKAAVTEETAQGFPVEINARLDGNFEMLVRGKAAHGSMPYLGVNAAISAAMILRKVFGSKAGKAIDFLCDTIGRDVNGKTLGIYLEDPETGNLTLNVGIVQIEDGNATVTMDIRFPANGSVDMVLNGCKILDEQYGVTRVPDQLANPHYVPKDSELVTKLMDAYREVTGITDAAAETTGGGTYAKPMGGNFVAFGAEFPGRPDYKIHDANEHYGLDDWFEHCIISTYAVIKLAA